MSLLIALLIGLGVGAATGFWFKRNADYLLVDFIMGVSGSILGLALAFFTHSDQEFGLFSWRTTVIEIVGAAVFVAIYQLSLKIPKKKKKSIE